MSEKELRKVLAAGLLGVFLTVACACQEGRGPGPATSAAHTGTIPERLAAIADELQSSRAILAHGSDSRIAKVREALDKTEQPGKRRSLQGRLALELLWAGRTEDAIAELLRMRELLEQAEAGIDPKAARRLGDSLSTAYLRLGEQENCLAQHGPESCLLPIRGSGIHRATRGSRMAIGELEQLLRDEPDEPAWRWLINLAYMTLGEYPDGVPESLRIPPESFASEDDIGRFPNIAGRLGVDMRSLAGGAIMEDFDNDGCLDIMASGWGLREQLRYFRNDCAGSFAERTAEAGLVGEIGGLNLLHADYDGDGDADVLVLRGAWLGPFGLLPNSLLRNDGGSFTNVTRKAGIYSEHPTQAAAWGDYDNDGDLDLFIGNESTAASANPCELYRNDGDGTFSEVAADVGLARVGFVKGTVWGDYDNDGRLDLYVSQMAEPNTLYRNDGPGEDGRHRFTDVTEQAGVAEPLNSFPVWFWDYDNDGWLDLLVLPYPLFDTDNLGVIADSYLGRPTGDAPTPRLYRNRGDGSFEDRTAAAGLDVPMLAMGANFGDLDNDGWVDVYVGTGEVNLHTLVPNRMYRNRGGERFLNVTTSGGFGNLQKGHGIAFGDIDNDGDQDVYAVMGGAVASDLAYNTLFLNPGQGNHWLTLRLEGVRANRAGIGARITVTVDEDGRTREIRALAGTGGSFGSSSLQQEIGLGRSAAIRAVEIRWPGSGHMDRLEGLELDTTYLVREGAGEATPVTAPRIDLGG